MMNDIFQLRIRTRGLRGVMRHAFVNRDANHFPGYTRGKIAEQLEASEQQWLTEKEERIDLDERLKNRIKDHNDIHWEVKAVQGQLEKEQEGHRKLNMECEATQERVSSILETTKYLKRDQKHLKQKIQHLTQTRNKLQDIAKAKGKEERQVNEELQEVRREWLGQEETAHAFAKYQLKEAKSLLKVFRLVSKYSLCRPNTKLTETKSWHLTWNESDGNLNKSLNRTQ